jgi:hypothetical protein
VVTKIPSRPAGRGGHPRGKRLHLGGEIARVHILVREQASERRNRAFRARPHHRPAAFQRGRVDERGLHSVERRGGRREPGTLELRHKVVRQEVRDNEDASLHDRARSTARVTWAHRVARLRSGVCSGSWSRRSVSSSVRLISTSPDGRDLGLYRDDEVRHGERVELAQRGVPFEADLQVVRQRLVVRREGHEHSVTNPVVRGHVFLRV